MMMMMMMKKMKINIFKAYTYNLQLSLKCGVFWYVKPIRFERYFIFIIIIIIINENSKIIYIVIYKIWYIEIWKNLKWQICYIYIKLFISYISKYEKKSKMTKWHFFLKLFYIRKIMIYSDIFYIAI